MRFAPLFLSLVLVGCKQEGAVEETEDTDTDIAGETPVERLDLTDAAEISNVVTMLHPEWLLSYAWWPRGLGAYAPSQGCPTIGGNRDDFTLEAEACTDEVGNFFDGSAHVTREGGTFAGWTEDLGSGAQVWDGSFDAVEQSDGSVLYTFDLTYRNPYVPGGRVVGSGELMPNAYDEDEVLAWSGTLETSAGSVTYEGEGLVSMPYGGGTCWQEPDGGTLTVVGDRTLVFAFDSAPCDGCIDYTGDDGAEGTACR